MIAPKDILGIITNAMRGGQWREWFRVDESRMKWLSSDALNAIIYFALVFYITHDWKFALLNGVMMWVGSAPGWGDYIGAMGGWRTANLKESWFIDPFIFWLKKSPVLWGLAGMTLRGAFWGAVLALPFAAGAFFDLPDYIPALSRMDVALEFLWRGAAMGLVYKFAIEWAKLRVGTQDGRWQGAAWALGELLYGGVLWSALTAY